jgi:hypothetical protein
LQVSRIDKVLVGPVIIVRTSTTTKEDTMGIEAPTLTGSSTSTVILPGDFNKNTADPNRHHWTAGQLRHVVAALAGTPVAVVVDNQTGHTVVGVTLLAVTYNRPGHDLLVEYTHADPSGAVTTSRTRHRIHSIGQPILPLGKPNGGLTEAKWIATDSVREEGSAAIKVVREGKYGEAAGRQWGSWKAEPTIDGSIVKYVPSTGNPNFADQWGTKVTVEVALDGRIVRVYEGI